MSFLHENPVKEKDNLVQKQEAVQQKSGQTQTPPAFNLEASTAQLKTESTSTDQKGTVTASRLNIRKGPGSKFGIAAPSLRVGQVVNILAEQEGWFKISEGQWVSGRYIQLESKKEEQKPEEDTSKDEPVKEDPKEEGKQEGSNDSELIAGIAESCYVAINKHFFGTGWGTDENAVYSSLKMLNKDQSKINQLFEYYQSKYGRNLVQDIYGDFSNNFLFGNELDQALELINLGPAKKQEKQEKQQTPENDKGKEDKVPFGAPKEAGEDEKSAQIVEEHLKKDAAEIKVDVETYKNHMKQLHVVTSVDSMLRFRYRDDDSGRFVAKSYVQGKIKEATKTAEEETPKPKYSEFKYASQRDNEFNESNVFSKKTERIYGDNMCNVTTLAMNIMQLAGDEMKAKASGAKILIDAGYSGKQEDIVKMQMEDIIMRIFKQLGDKYFQAKCGVAPNTEYGPHQYASCLNHVAGLFTDYVGQAEHVGSVETKEDYEKKVKPALQDGAAVMLSTKLTGGHIVQLVDVKDDGLIINDPYGFKLPNGYVKNGDKGSKSGSIKVHRETFDVRFKENPEVKAEIEAQMANPEFKVFGANIGMFNFYTWEEVTKYRIGKWVNIMKKA